MDAGETPRGEKSMVIKTDHGPLKSKYHYLGSRRLIIKCFSVKTSRTF